MALVYGGLGYDKSAKWRIPLYAISLVGYAHYTRIVRSECSRDLLKRIVRASLLELTA